MNSSLYLMTGIGGLLVSIYSGLKYYAITGKGLIPPEKAKQMISTHKIKHIIDVRTNIEYSIGHYPKAKNIPVLEMNADDFKNMNKRDGILVYCNTGQRARRAAENIRSYGFKNVYYIEGSYTGLM